MAVLSLPEYVTIDTSCIEYVHPWTDSCRDSTLGLLFHAFPHSLKTYITVYLFTMIMRRKKPTKKVVKKTILEILRSTVFLTTHAYGFSTVVCSLRHITGRFDKYSVSFTPAFLSSLVAIHLERPSRRPILCLYVTNVATETLFRMAVWRGWVKTVRHGQIIIFTLSSASLLFMFRRDPGAKDTMFSIIRIAAMCFGHSQRKTLSCTAGMNSVLLTYCSVSLDRNKLGALILLQQPSLKCLLLMVEYLIGSHEEAKDPERVFEENSPQRESPYRDIYSNVENSSNSSMYIVIGNICRLYRSFINLVKHQKRSSSCPHPNSCLFYGLQGLGRMLAVGYAIQVALNLVLSAKRIIRKPSTIFHPFFKNKVLNLGAFLGLFSGIFRGASCALRWFTKKDSEYHAIPAGLLAGTSFWFYPDNTAALYVMWKALQIIYCKLIEAGYLPEVPFGTILLYSFSTAVLFHAALLEPQNLRSSYYRFLYGLSGGRIAAMARAPLDRFMLETSKHHTKVMENLKLDPNPVFNFQFFGNSYPNLS